MRVKWEDQWYYGIHKFDCHEVTLYTYPDGAIEKRWGYATVLPISPAGYRRTNPTRAKVEIEYETEQTVFNIWDDWGEKYVMIIPNEMKEEIEAALEGARKLELIECGGH